MESVAIYTINRLGQVTARMSQIYFSRVVAAQRMGALLAAQENARFRYAMTGDEAWQAAFREKELAFFDWLDTAKETVRQDKEGRDLLAKVASLYQTYLGVHDELVRLVRRGTSFRRREALLLQGQKILQNLLALQDSLVLQSEERLNRLRDEAKSTENWAVGAIYGTTAGLLALGLLVSLGTGYSFNRRWKKLMRAVEAMRRGETVMPAVSGSDEIGQLAEALIRLQEKVKTREQELEVLSETDPLTGANNLRFFHRKLAELASDKGGMPFALMIMDLDNFKEVNDQRGHLTGDEVLAQSARIVSGLVRKRDLVARYGGDEFILIAPGLGAEEARGLAERIRQAMGKKLSFYGVTVSIGLACFPDEAETPAALLHLADQRLYRAKQAGKNRVVSNSSDEVREATSESQVRRP